MAKWYEKVGSGIKDAGSAVIGLSTGGLLGNDPGAKPAHT